MAIEPLKFSDRIGVTQPPELLQIESMNDPLRASLWNVINAYFEDSRGWSAWDAVARVTAVNFTKVPVDSLPVYAHLYKGWVRDQYFSLQWFDVYNYIEFLTLVVSGILPDHTDPQEKLTDDFNYILERENSGYRFLSGELAPITSVLEIDEISSAMLSTQGAALNGANAHLKTALALFSQKPTPDFRNATKEAISAIESIATILGATAPGLAGSLGALSKKAPIHPALTQAFIKLYGYASNEGGIRHSLGEQDSAVGFDEAKYMIVACSAFMNYLIAKTDKAGLLANKP